MLFREIKKAQTVLLNLEFFVWHLVQKMKFSKNSMANSLFEA